MLLIFFYDWPVAFDHLHVNADPDVIEKPGDTSLEKLKDLYSQAKELSETEVKYDSSHPFAC